MTRIGAFIFGTASLVASCLLGWHLNGFVFEVFAKYLMTYEVNNDLKYSATMVLALIVSAIATEAFYKFAFTRPKIEIIPPHKVKRWTVR